MVRLDPFERQTVGASFSYSLARGARPPETDALIIELTFDVQRVAPYGQIDGYPVMTAAGAFLGRACLEQG